MEFTKNEIMDYVERLDVSGMLKGRFCHRVLGRFPTAGQFLRASDKEIGSHHIYGKGMMNLVQKVKEEFYLREKNEKGRVELDGRVREYMERLKTAHEAALRELNPVFDLKELQGIVSMMQLMCLERIDLRLINQFMASVKCLKGTLTPNDQNAPPPDGVAT